jgi:hypothetical protein
MRSVKDAYLNRLVFFGEAALLTAVREFALHFHTERNHQGLGNRLIKPGEGVGRLAGEVVCRERSLIATVVDVIWGSTSSASPAGASCHIARWVEWQPAWPVFARAVGVRICKSLTGTGICVHP